MQAHKCGHCGGLDLEWTSDDDVTCRHCGTRYRKVPKAAPKVVIAKGANVVFGKNAKVTVRGGMEIQKGANVRIDGELEFELEVVELGKGLGPTPPFHASLRISHKMHYVNSRYRQKRLSNQRFSVRTEQTAPVSRPPRLHINDLPRTYPRCGLC